MRDTLRLPGGVTGSFNRRLDYVDYALLATLSNSVETTEIENPVLACPRCNSRDFGSHSTYTNRWKETRRVARCRSCKHCFYLAVGQDFERNPKLTRAQQEQFVVAEDARPACPFCSGQDVTRRGLIHLASGKTTQRWHCNPCGKRFVSDAHRVATLDRRKVSHWEEVDPKVEARFLFLYARRHSDIRGMRRLIDVSERERADLALLVSEGVLTETEVNDALWFRSRVLEIFDGLVAEHERCREFLAERGMTADRLAEPFAQLVGC